MTIKTPLQALTGRATRRGANGAGEELISGEALSESPVQSLAATDGVEISTERSSFILISRLINAGIKNADTKNGRERCPAENQREKCDNILQPENEKQTEEGAAWRSGRTKSQAVNFAHILYNFRMFYDM